MQSNRDEDLVMTQPKTLEERREAARILVERLAYDLPLAIDSMDGAAETAYAAWPERLYVVGAGGRIVYRGRVGPFGFDTDELERILAAHLDDPGGPTP
jgi:hypothetical protein